MIPTTSHKAAFLALLMLNCSITAQEELWNKSFNDIQFFGVSAGDKHLFFEKNSETGKLLMGFLTKMTVAGPSLPLGELVSTSDEAINFSITGHDNRKHALLAMIVVELKGGLTALRIIKIPEQASKLKDFTYTFEIKKWPTGIISPENLTNRKPATKP
jgi:hypothetical protein